MLSPLFILSICNESWRSEWKASTSLTSADIISIGEGNLGRPLRREWESRTHHHSMLYRHLNVPVLVTLQYLTKIMNKKNRNEDFKNPHLKILKIPIYCTCDEFAPKRLASNHLQNLFLHLYKVMFLLLIINIRCSTYCRWEGLFHI